MTAYLLIMAAYLLRSALLVPSTLSRASFVKSAPDINPALDIYPVRDLYNRSGICYIQCRIYISSAGYAISSPGYNPEGICITDADFTNDARDNKNQLFAKFLDS